MHTPSQRQRFRLALDTDGAENQREAYARDVASGLTSRPKRLSSKFLYDEKGSVLFEEICELPEYYLTRAESELLENHAEDIISRLPCDVTLVELGSGSSVKTRLLIERLLSKQDSLTYVPIDISRSAVEMSSIDLVNRYAGLEIDAIAAEYERGLEMANRRDDGARLILWLGSTIGNLDRPEAVGFVRDIRGTMGPDDRLLIGIDLRKERHTLESAYDDSRGVTACFNKNLLARINREFSGEFDLEAFEHRACFKEDEGRIEMHLVSRWEQEVAIRDLDLSVSLEAGESIHTENSYKYSLDEIATLGRESLLRLDGPWFDAGRQFSANLFARA